MKPLAKFWAEDKIRFVPVAKPLQERTTTVRAHPSHSKKGKAFVVRQFERKVHSTPKAWVNDLKDKKQVESLLLHAQDPEMNLFLRGELKADELDFAAVSAAAVGEAAKAQVKQFVDHVDDAIEGFALPKDMTVYRGVAYERKPSWLKPGVIMRDKAWMSTSSKESVAKEMLDEYGDVHSIMLKVKLPKGTKAAPLFALKENPFRYQQEYLLKRNSAIKVKKVTEKVFKDPDDDYVEKRYFVEAEYVRQ